MNINHWLIYFAFYATLGPVCSSFGFGSSADGKVLLRDIQVLTFHSGRMTTGRRSNPVSQLKCIGGSASNSFNPNTVQCYNRGWDGADVQWECKTEMDDSLKFGMVEVVCEGYDYPDDPFILKGSCGLEYTLDFTDQSRQAKAHSWFSPSSSHWSSNNKTSTGGFGDLVLLFVVGIVFYAIYKTCLTGQDMSDRQFSSTNDDYPGGTPGGGGWFNQRPSHQYYDRDTGDGCSRRAQSGTGGFWSGMATGGLIGYMFGNRTRDNYYQTSWPNYGGRGFSNGTGGLGTSSSSGTRTASGFGGTRRR